VVPNLGNQAVLNWEILHEVRDRHGNISEAVLELKFRRILVQPPLYKQRRYPALELTVLHATERGKPKLRNDAVSERSRNQLTQRRCRNIVYVPKRWCDLLDLLGRHLVLFEMRLPLTDGFPNFGDALGRTLC
jgi:hypothetical protein